MVVLRGLGDAFLRISIFTVWMSQFRVSANFPAIRQEEGLLDSLGRLDRPDSSVPMSRNLAVGSDAFSRRHGVRLRRG